MRHRVLCLLLAGIGGSSRGEPPAVLLTGGIVYVSPDEAPAAASVLLEKGHVRFIGPADDARRLVPGARTISLAGAAVYPGFVDAHGHLLGLGLAKQSLALRGKSKAEVLDLVSRAARSTPRGDWIRGRGWDQNLWEGKGFPTAAELTRAAPTHPVLLTRVDGHAVWANGPAMERAGVTSRTDPDPAGGRIERDASGRPAGVFVDNAMALVTQATEKSSAAEMTRLFTSAFDACARVGLTGVGDASGYAPDAIAVLRDMARGGRMPIRVYGTVGGHGTSDLTAVLDAGRTSEGPLTVRAVKVYADGALGSRGAALLADYTDDPGNRGLLLTPPAQLEDLARLCFSKGWQIWTHAIGDRGNRMTLDAYARALDAVKPRDPRPRIEHAQVLASEDIPRLAALGVIASMQPTHATSDMPWAEARVGPARIAGAYAWRRLLASGARLAGGSDFPVESEDPLAGFYAAVTRQDDSGRPPGGWRADEALSRKEALSLFTAGAAYAEFAEGRRGRLAPGYDADVTVLDRDIVSDKLPPSEILRARVLLTVVGGQVVYRAPEAR